MVSSTSPWHAPYSHRFLLSRKVFPKKRFIFYVTSVALFMMAVFLAHFSTFMLPVFVILPLVQFIDSKSKIKSLALGVTLTIPFVAISYIFNSQDGQKPTTNPLKFVLIQDRVIQKTTYQVPIISLPPDIIKLIAKNWPNGSLSYPFTKAVDLSTKVLLIIYIGVIFWIRKGESRLTKLYLTSLLGALTIMFLYVYVDVKLDVYKGIGQSRQFFLSTILLSIVWSIILYVLFSKRQRLYFFSSLIILTIYVISNSIIINKHIDSIQYSSEMMQRFITYTKSISDQFTSESIMITPSYLGWPNPMFKLFYAPLGFAFALPLPGWEEEFRSNSENVFIFDYDYERSGSSFDPARGKVINLTEKYRAGEKIKFLQ